MDNQKAIIYGLVDPRTGQLYYVGSTGNLGRRIYEYMRMTGLGSEVQDYLRSIRDGGLKFRVRVIEVVSEDMRGQREKFWIIKSRQDGNPILNKGLHVHGKKMRKKSLMTDAWTR